MKTTERFSNRAEDYRRYRPGYPKPVLDLIRDTCGLRTGAPLADIGSGTGILTKLLLEAGFDVTAVEPNEPMRLIAEEDLRHFPRFHSVAATAEQTGLPDASFDAITVAQAFHWFDHERVAKEFRRLLRPQGFAFIIRNKRRPDCSPFSSDYEDLLKSLGYPYETAAHRDGDADTRGLRLLFPSGASGIATFDNPHAMDWPALRGRFLSSSYVPAKGDPGHDECLDRLERIFRKHAASGRVTFDQETEIHYGKP